VYNHALEAQLSAPQLSGPQSVANVSFFIVHFVIF
jgi:hypothetical protein